MPTEMTPERLEDLEQRWSQWPEVLNLIAALRESREREARVREALRDVLLFRLEEHIEGCLYCGKGEIVDGKSLPHVCWYEKAEALAKEPADD